MKTSKRIVLLLLTLMLSVGMTLSVGATANPSHSVTGRDETSSVTFTYEVIAGIEGVITFSNPELFANVEFSQAGFDSGNYNEENGKFSYYGANTENKATFTVKYTMVSEIEGGTTCDITIKYRTTDEEGNLSEWNTETATVMAPYLRLLGDVNYDGIIDKKDYAIIKRYNFNTAKLEGSDFDAADVNCDRFVNSRDYALLKRYCFGTAKLSKEYIEVSQMPSK